MVTDYSKGTWSEGTIKNINGVPTNVGGGVFTPTPASTPTPAPTPVPTYSRLPSTLPVITPTPDVPATPVSTFNEANSRSSEIARRSNYISAIEGDYQKRISDMANAETKLGEKDLARANTISAMTGMAGSPEATTRAGGVDRATKDIIQQKTDTLNSAKMREIAGIYDSIDQNVQREKELAAATDRETRTKSVDDMTKAANNNIMSFAAQGIDWDTAWNGAGDPAHAKLFQDEVKRSGKSVFEIQTLYNNSLPPEKKPKEIYSGWKGDNFVTITQKPDGTISNKTITSKELGITPGTDVATVIFDGQVHWYDKNKPFNADGTPNIMKLGADKVTGTTTPDPKYTPSQTDISGALTSMRTDPAYIPAWEEKYKSDPIFQAKIIEAWKAKTKAESTARQG